MALQYKVIERGQAGITGGDTKKYYANTITSGEVHLKKRTTSIER